MTDAHLSRWLGCIEPNQLPLVRWYQWTQEVERWRAVMPLEHAELRALKIVIVDMYDHCEIEATPAERI